MADGTRLKEINKSIKILEEKMQILTILPLNATTKWKKDSSKLQENTY